MPYTYLIGWPEYNMFYYGCRYAKDCNPNDLFVIYMTSSGHVAEFVERYGKPSLIEIRKFFTDIEACRAWEHKVLRRLNVSMREDFLNKTDGKSLPPMYGDANPSKREEVKEKISRAKTGKKRPDVSKRMKESHPMKDPEVAIRSMQTRKENQISGTAKTTKGRKRPELSGKNHPKFGLKNPSLSNGNTIEYTCPHCNKTGKGPAMKYYHFDNCKTIRTS